MKESLSKSLSEIATSSCRNTLCFKFQHVTVHSRKTVVECTWLPFVLETFHEYKSIATVSDDFLHETIMVTFVDFGPHERVYYTVSNHKSLLTSTTTAVARPSTFETVIRVITLVRDCPRDSRHSRYAQSRSHSRPQISESSSELQRLPCFCYGFLLSNLRYSMV